MDDDDDAFEVVDDDDDNNDDSVAGEGGSESVASFFVEGVEDIPRHRIDDDDGDDDASMNTTSLDLPPIDITSDTMNDNDNSVDLSDLNISDV